MNHCIDAMYSESFAQISILLRLKKITKQIHREIWICKSLSLDILW